MIFDNTGQLITTSAQLRQQAPALPPGVLAYARLKGQNRVTWQPEPGVRIAAVVVSFVHGHVLSGRSLREVEKPEDQAQLQSGLAILVIWTATFIFFGFEEILQKRKQAVDH